MDLRDRFHQSCSRFTEDHNLIENLWSKVERRYSEKGRYYHNLEHLENMFSEVNAVKDQIENYTIISFSIFYHDIIYNSSSKFNEEKSAEFAISALKKLNINQGFIKKISEQIIATKSHQKSDDNDTSYLLDADLSILGKDPKTYLDYTKQIRKEYSIYPDLLYKPGRKKVLKHFLELENIFKTKEFSEKYEAQARENLLFEIGML